MNVRRPNRRTEDWRRTLIDTLRALALALLVHVAGFALLWLGSLNWQPRRPPPVAAFTLVNAAPMIERMREDAEAQQREQLARRQAEAARQALERARAEQQRLEQQRAAEQQRQQEDQRQAALELQRQRQLEREREAARQAEVQRQAEQQRLAEEQRRLDELQRLRDQREAAERERLEQQRRLAELAEQRAAEAERRQAEAEAERLRLAREQAAREARRATLRDEYVATIQELVRRNWLRPPTANPGLRCAVRVVQIPGGQIIDQAIVSPCNADEPTRRSILSAVERTEFLPYRGYEDVFEREIEFVFRYDGD